jgi:hypothetical protein
VRWAEHVAGRREKQISHRILVRKAEGMRRISRPQFRWENNIETGLKRNKVGRNELELWNSALILC